MNKAITKKILSTLVLTLFLVQALVPSTVLAENKGLDYDNPNKNGDNPYKVSLKGVLNSGMLTSLVGCTGIVDKVSKVTTTFIQKLLTNKKDKAKQETEQNGKGNTSVLVLDGMVTPLTLEALQKAQESADKAAFTENCLKGIATTLVKNQLTSMTKYTMNWITTGFNGDPMYVRDVNSYMDSITTGLLKKENELFKDPANAGAYPYGRDYAVGQINAYKSGKDAYGALKQDLTNYLEEGATPESFANDFSQGGWNGWLALTQRPENNPLGFTLKATENLGQEKANATQNAKDELTQNGGFFGQKKCVEYEPIIKTSRPRTCNGGTPEDELLPGTTCVPDQTTTSTPSSNTVKSPKDVTSGDVIPYTFSGSINGDTTSVKVYYNGSLLVDKKFSTSGGNASIPCNYSDVNCAIQGLRWEAYVFGICGENMNCKPSTYKESTTNTTSTASTTTTISSKPPKCIRYETVTPGSVIKTKVDTYINSPERQAELAKTLNDSLNSLFSVLVNRFIDQGLSGLGSNFTTPVSGGFGSNSIVDGSGNVMSSATIFDDNTPSNSSINNNIGPFDITKDLGNKYVQATNAGSWDANSNTPELSPGVGIKNQYYVVSTAGYTKLFANNPRWTVGQKAFFDGTTWRVGVPNHIIERKGVFQTQKDYLKSIKRAVVVLPKVIPKLAELDYCIPGPNQSWESNSSEAKNEYFNYLSGVGTEYISDVYDECPFIGCDGIQTIGGWLNGGLDHSYNVISLPDSSAYEKVFDDARNLWDKIVNQEFFWIAKNTVHLTYSFSSDHWAVDPNFVASQVKKWTDLATKNYNEYVIKAREKYGITSPMRSEFTPEGEPNPKFLPMAQAGLDMTKNLTSDAEDLPKAISDANDSLAQANGTTYRLGFIKDKVNVIVAAAQARRKTRRIADGLPAMPQICLDNEKVTWVENDILKY